jgi:hypothetical protein
MRIERHPGWEPWWYSNFDDYPPRKPRKRKLSLRSAMQQARRAGMNVSSAAYKVDGSIELMFGQATSPGIVENAERESANPWDVVLQ